MAALEVLFQCRHEINKPAFRVRLIFHYFIMVEEQGDECCVSA